MYNPLETATRQARTLKDTAHRPWPLPDGAWQMGQSWLRLLFAHWTVPAESLRPLLPQGLELELFDGHAWLGITPFKLEGLRPRGLPPTPFVSDFLEANARTYVTAGGKPGIWFFTLDSSSRLGVAGGRFFYRLPYHHVDAAMSEDDGTHVFDSTRLTARYRAVGEPSRAAPGSLEYFLTERYCLYTQHEDRLCRAEIHHPPWPLRRAEGEVTKNEMPPVEVPRPGDPLLHFAQRQDVLVWSLDPV
jgi:uncharacterized protein YqjF (DUF2071 family)